MALKQGILQLLGANAGVQAIVPNDVAGTPQIYWTLAPKSAKAPYIVLNQDSTLDTYTMAGPISLRGTLVQVDCYVDTMITTNAAYVLDNLATAARLALWNFKGTLPDTDATVVNGVFIEKDWPMPYEEGSKGYVLRQMLEFRVWYYDN
jgi:hypothetical protein